MAKVPQTSIPLGFGQVKKDVSPILSNKQYQPDPVAPPIGAAAAEHSAKQTAALAQGVGQAANIISQIALKRQEDRNRNDAANADIEYKEGLFEIQQELSQATGKDARGAQARFNEKELELRSRILQPLNNNVKSRIEPMMMNSRLRGSQNMFNHEQKEMAAETTAATQLVAETWIQESLNSGSDSTEQALKKINSVTKDNLPGKTESEVEVWRMAQKGKLYEGHMLRLLADKHNPAAVATAVEYFKEHSDSMPSDTASRFAPAISEAVFEQTVESNFNSIKGMDYLSQIKYVNGIESEDMKRSVRAKVNAHHAEQQAIRVETGRLLERKLFSAMSSAEIMPEDGASRLKFLREYQLSLSPAEREAFRPHVDSLLREFAGDFNQQRNAAKREMELRLYFRPDSKIGEDGEPGFFHKDNQALMDKYVEDGLIDAPWASSLRDSATRRYLGVDGSTGKRIGAGVPENLTKELNSLIDSWAKSSNLDPNSPSDSTIIGNIREDLSHLIMTSSDASSNQLFDIGSEFINNLFQDKKYKDMEPRIDMLREAVEVWNINGGQPFNIKTIDSIAQQIMAESDINNTGAWIMAFEYAADNGLMTPEQKQFFADNKAVMQRLKKEDEAKRQYNISIGAPEDISFSELIKQDLYSREHELNLASGGGDAQAGADIRYNEARQALEEKGYIVDGKVPEGLAGPAFSVAVSEGMSLKIRKELIETMSMEDIRRNQAWVWEFIKGGFDQIPDMYWNEHPKTDPTKSRLLQQHPQAYTDERKAFRSKVYADFRSDAWQWLLDLNAAWDNSQQQYLQEQLLRQSESYRDLSNTAPQYNPLGDN